VLNAEEANLSRAVRASYRQSLAIAALAQTDSLSDLSVVDQRVARARIEAPEATLGELAEGLDMTRSRVQRALGRIERLARDDLSAVPSGGHASPPAGIGASPG